MNPYRNLVIALFLLTLPATAQAESFFDFFRFTSKDAKVDVNPDNSGSTNAANPPAAPIDPNTYLATAPSYVTITNPTPVTANSLLDRSLRFRETLTKYAQDKNSVFGCLNQEGEGANDPDNLGRNARTFVEDAVKIFEPANYFTRSLELSQRPFEPTYGAQEMVRNGTAEAIELIRPQLGNLIHRYPCLPPDDTLKGLLMGATFILPSLGPAR